MSDLEGFKAQTSEDPRREFLMLHDRFNSNPARARIEEGRDLSEISRSPSIMNPPY